MEEFNLINNQETENEMRASMQEFTLPHYKEIPDVGLFLEQVAKYIDGYTKELDSVTLTGSMISNYVKKKIIANPVKKQYGREQIAYLIFISITKTVLSLEDVQLMFELQKQTCSCEQAYEYFRQELIDMFGRIFDRNSGSDREAMSGSDSGSLGSSMENEESAEGTILLKNTIVTVAHKVYLDKYFAILRSRRQ